MEAKTYSNPRLEAAIENWPIGGGKRGTMYFRIEQKGNKERAIRYLNCSGVKKLTYAAKARIVDGSDGRTYILELTQYGGFISVKRGDMKYDEESIFPDNPRYEGLKQLFD